MHIFASPCRLAFPSLCLHTNILVLQGWVPAAPCPTFPDPATPVTQFSPACHLLKIPQQGAWGYGREGLPIGSGSLPQAGPGERDGVRKGPGRTFSDKGLTSASSRQEQPSTTESPAVNGLTGGCCVQAARVWVWVCVWPSPWEHCGSASQVRGTVWGQEVGEGVPTPTRAPAKPLCLSGLRRV